MILDEMRRKAKKRIEENKNKKEDSVQCDLETCLSMSMHKFLFLKNWLYVVQVDWI